MAVPEHVALRMAARVERTGGPRAGLVAYRAIADRAKRGDLLGAALIAGLRCALTLGDLQAAIDLTSRWEAVVGGSWDVDLNVLCKRMVREHATERAIALAHAELRRAPTALAHYRYARCLDVNRHGSTSAAAALDAFAAAVARAEKEGTKDLEHAARVRRAAILAGSWATIGEALEEAGRVDLAAVPFSLRIVLGRILLRSPSRFVRASAVSALDAVANAGGMNGAHALSVLARYFDDARGRVTSLELDRLRAAFGRARPELVSVLEHGVDTAEPDLAALRRRAEELARGRYEVPREEVPLLPGAAALRAHRLGAILDVAVALRDSAPARAARILRSLTEVDRSEQLPAEVLVVADVAAASSDDGLRAAGLAFLAARLREGRGPAPPRGFLPLADGCADDLALVALARRAAAALREPGASDLLAQALVCSGWVLAARGERRRAIEALSEAKRLSPGQRS